MGFIMCVLMGSLCFTLASLYLPFLIIKSRKFAMLYTLGSLFLILSFSMLWGPVNHIRHLLTVRSLPFTTLYFGSMFATLYFSISAHNTGLTVLFAAVQIMAIVWYIVSFIPGGQTGLKFFSKIFSSVVTKTVSKTLPVWLPKSDYKTMQTSFSLLYMAILCMPYVIYFDYSMNQKINTEIIVFIKMYYVESEKL